MNSRCFELRVFVIILSVAIVFLPSAVSGASVKIDAGDLFKVILEEVINESSKTAPEGTVLAETPEPVERTTSASTSSAQSLIKVVVTGDKVNLRDKPSMKGKVVTQGYLQEDMLAEGGYVKTVLLVDPTPLKDSSDGTSWYKISFENFQQIQYRYNMPYLYVNTKYVKKVPFLKRDKEFIAYFIQGRPPLFNVGDDFLKLKEITGGTDSGTYRRTKTKKPLNLHLEPKKESQTFILPAGSLIVDLTHVSLYAGVDAWDHPQLGHYEDMKDRFWYAIIEGESLKVVGWLDQDSAGSMLGGWNNDGEIIDDPSHGKGRYNFDWNEFDL